jgi:acetyltransferase-like isoleucine patch superfamily enzyme
MNRLLRKQKIPVFQMIFIGFLPSIIKKSYYRIKGYSIGKNVSIGFGSVIIGKEVQINDGVKIGLLSVIRGRIISIDRFVKIGMMTMIDTEKIKIGEDTRINENVIIGGMKTPESEIDIGKRVIIMEYSFINPTKPIKLGDDTGIGGHCLLFTHGSWLSELEGYPVTFASITIGKKVWLPWRVFILPGVNIGDNVVIGANSLITKNFPSNVLIAGSPAKILKENYPAPISDKERSEKIDKIFNEFISFIKYNEYDVEIERKNQSESLVLIVREKKKRHVLVYQNDNSVSIPNKADILILNTNDNPNNITALMTLNLKNNTRIGTSKLGEEFTIFISRYGVRFDRLD